MERDSPKVKRKIKAHLVAIVTISRQDTDVYLYLSCLLVITDG
jgi:hypothetical protein